MDNEKRKTDGAQQERRVAKIVMVVGLVVMAGFAYLVFRSDGGATPPTDGSSTAAGSSSTLVYADYADVQDLHRMDIATGSDAIALELPYSGDTKAAPGSSWISIVVPTETGNDIQPAVHLFDAATQQERDLGVGLFPTWSPDGTRVAWAKPEDPDSCGLEKCRSAVIVTVTDPTTGDSSALTDPGKYRVLGWSGDYVMVQNGDAPGNPVVQSVSPDGDSEDLPMAPQEYWGASPDGRYVVQTSSVATNFLEMEDGQVTGAGPQIEIPAGTILGPGTWSHDSSRIAAFALGEDDGLEFVTVAPDAPEPVTLYDGGESTTSIMLWSPDNDAVLFQRFTGSELEAVHCPIDDPDACDVLLTWTRGIALLRIE